MSVYSELLYVVTKYNLLESAVVPISTIQAIIDHHVEDEQDPKVVMLRDMLERCARERPVRPESDEYNERRIWAADYFRWQGERDALMLMARVWSAQSWLEQFAWSKLLFDIEES